MNNAYLFQYENYYFIIKIFKIVKTLMKTKYKTNFYFCVNIFNRTYKDF